MNVLKNILGRFENKAFNIFKNDGYISFDRFFSELEKNNGIYISSNIKKDNLLFYEFNSKINKKQLISVVPLSIKVENKRITLYVFIRKIGKNYKIVNLKKEIPDWADVYNNKQELITTGDKKLIFERHLSKAKKGSIKDQLAIGEAYFYGRYGKKRNHQEALFWFKKIIEKDYTYPSIVDYYIGIIAFNYYIEKPKNKKLNDDIFRIAYSSLSNFLYIYLPTIKNYTLPLQFYKKCNDLNTEYYDVDYIDKVLVGRAAYIFSLLSKDYYKQTNNIAFVKLYLNSIIISISRYYNLSTVHFSKKLESFIDVKENNSSFYNAFDKELYSLLANKRMGEVLQDGDYAFYSYPIISYKSIEVLLKPVAFVGAKDKEAARLLGDIFSNSNNLDYNYKAAEYWYKLSKNNYSLANFYFKLGKEYFVKENYNKAYEYLKKSANYNDDDAMYYLGQIYDNGLGVKQNLNKAIYWYQKAANSGNEEAKEALEILK